MHPSDRLGGGGVLEDQAQALAIGRIERDSVLRHAHQKVMTQTLAFYHIFVNIRFTVGDPHPANRRVGRGRSDRRPESIQRCDSRSRYSRHFEASLGSPAGRGWRTRYCWSARPSTSNGGRCPLASGRAVSGAPNGEDRMEQEPLAVFRRAADRAQALDRRRRWLNEMYEVSSMSRYQPGLRSWVRTRPAMAGLDGVRGGLGAVEDVVGGLDVILARKQLGDGLAGPGGEGLGVSHDPFPPGAMPEPNPLELLACPDIGGCLVSGNTWQHG